MILCEVVQPHSAIVSASEEQQLVGRRGAEELYAVHELFVVAKPIGHSALLQMPNNDCRVLARTGDKPAAPTYVNLRDEVRVTLQRRLQGQRLAVPDFNHATKLEWNLPFVACRYNEFSLFVEVGIINGGNLVSLEVGVAENRFHELQMLEALAANLALDVLRLGQLAVQHTKQVLAVFRLQKVSIIRLSSLLESFV